MRIVRTILFTAIVFWVIFFLFYPEPETECLVELPFLTNIRRTFDYFAENIKELYADVLIVPYITVKAIKTIQHLVRENGVKNIGPDAQSFIGLEPKLSALLSSSLVNISETEYNKKFMNLFKLEWELPKKLSWTSDHNHFLKEWKDAYEADYLNENFEDNCLENLLANRCGSGMSDQLAVSSKCWNYNIDVVLGLRGYELTHKILYLLIALQTKCALPFASNSEFKSVEEILIFFSGKLMLSLREVNATMWKTKDVVMMDLTAETLTLGLLLGNAYFHDSYLAKFYADSQHECGCYTDRPRPLAVKSRILLMEKQLDNKCLMHLTSVSSLFLVLFTYYQIISSKCLNKLSMSEFILQSKEGAILCLLFVGIMLFCCKIMGKQALSLRRRTSQQRHWNFPS